MFAVIFKAKVKNANQTYIDTASAMRDLAMNEYGCTDFIAVTEGDQEIAISYWPSVEAIAKWKKNTQHQLAQKEGKLSWYHNYTVEVVEIIRQYSS